MTTKTEKAAAQVAAIREDILARLDLDKSTGHITTTEGEDLFGKHLPEGMTLDALKAADDYKTSFAAGYAGAVAHLAANGLRENKDLQQINHELVLHGKNKVQVMASREGGLQVAMVTPIVNAKVGALKSVFDDFNKVMDDLADGK